MEITFLPISAQVARLQEETYPTTISRLWGAVVADSQWRGEQAAGILASGREGEDKLEACPT
jgi:hypothetical protein